MSPFTPINAPLSEDLRTPHWLWVVMGSPEAIIKTALAKETEATVKEETEATAQSEHEAPARPAAERPVVEKRASVGSSSSTRAITNSGKVNNRKTCSRCNGKKYNMSNFKDHNKVHFLEDHGVTARFPCSCCKAGKCIVARCPKDIETYACIGCLKSHRQCSFNGLKTKKRKKCKPGAHPALLRPIEKA
ncbi:hypothetical protein FDENT_6499 [Fusarium denticulatum]|uniref:Uncharacterized protein n=1 Tax=Fusarium denticulatum TaxID=48507 RepID=A0A8H5UCH8_9HYPO|nr:hypothetical protein FDENT_6499 [Fusarium denticulatum]